MMIYERCLYDVVGVEAFSLSVCIEKDFVIAASLTWAMDHIFGYHVWNHWE